MPAQVEGPLYERWVKAGYFEVDATSPKPAYCIVLPPPNVTGGLHLGHAFEHLLIDALIRRRRMQGYETLRRPGMDHAGIATQTAVERELARDGLSRHDLGREAFVAKAGGRRESGGQILGQMPGSATACGRASGSRWTRDSRVAVLTIFAVVRRRSHLPRRTHHQLVPALPGRAVRHRGRAQRGRGRACPIRHGSIDDPRNSIVVATTRAETMLGDTAVAVHPDDVSVTPPRRHRGRASAHRSPHPPLSTTTTSILSSAPARSGDTWRTTRTDAETAPAQLAVAHCPRRARQHHRQRSVPRSRPWFEARPAVVAALRTRAHRRGGSGRTFTPSVTAPSL